MLIKQNQNVIKKVQHLISKSITYFLSKSSNIWFKLRILRQSLIEGHKSFAVVVVVSVSVLNSAYPSLNPAKVKIQLYLKIIEMFSTLQSKAETLGETIF